MPWPMATNTPGTHTTGVKGHMEIEGIGVSEEQVLKMRKGPA